ncbi:hypothetical protein VTJ04DRAFT_5752 [Mycothermus thermophilus]|uniref:uncharacterized protein n=1 Tax=Humicola insolens TaxID=85995 RepID=UPI0037431745
MLAQYIHKLVIILNGVFATPTLLRQVKYTLKEAWLVTTAERVPDYQAEGASRENGPKARSNKSSTNPPSQIPLCVCVCVCVCPNQTKQCHNRLCRHAASQINISQQNDIGT